jgi:hypothetical protein
VYPGVHAAICLHFALDGDELESRYCWENGDSLVCRQDMSMATLFDY